MPSNDEKQEVKKLPETRDRGWIKGFVISLIICVLLSALTVLNHIFILEHSFPDMLWTILSDAFAVPGLLLIMAYVLVWLSGEGAFDAVVYGVKVAFYTTFYKNLRDTKLPKNYTEYRLLRRQQEKLDVKFILYAGLIFFAIGCVMLVIHEVTA